MTSQPTHEALDRQVASFRNNLSAVTGGTAKQVAKTLAYDIFEVPGWPTDERATYITAGFSALLMSTSSVGWMGHELALPLMKESPAVDPAQFVESFGDYLMDRRLAVNDREFFPIEVDQSDDLGGVYVRIGSLLPKSVDGFYKAIPVTILELFLVDRVGGTLASSSTDRFAREFDSGLIRPMNWLTQRIY